MLFRSKESGVVQRLSDTAQNAMINIITIMLGLSVGAKADGSTFLDVSTLKIIAMGLAAFCFSTAGGVLLGKVLYIVTGGKINPLIGSAGVSAVPMAARVSQTVGAKENPTNFLLMHAMGSWGAPAPPARRQLRSEERRVGKECRSRWSPYH